MKSFIRRRFPLWHNRDYLLLWFGQTISSIGSGEYVFFDLAETASLPRVVSQEQLPAAISQNQVTFGITNLLGPPLGGVLYTLGRAVPFMVDAISYLVSVISLLFIKTKFQMERVVATRKLRTEIVEGMKWLWRQPLLRVMAFLNSGWSALGFGFSLMVIVIAQGQHLSPTFIGMLFAIGGVSRSSFPNVGGCCTVPNEAMGCPFRQPIASSPLIGG